MEGEVAANSSGTTRGIDARREFHDTRGLEIGKYEYPWNCIQHLRTTDRWSKKSNAREIAMANGRSPDRDRMVDGGDACCQREFRIVRDAAHRIGMSTSPPCSITACGISGSHTNRASDDFAPRASVRSTGAFSFTFPGIIPAVRTDVFVPSVQLLAARMHRRFVYDANRQRGHGRALIRWSRRRATTEFHGGMDMQLLPSRAATNGQAVRVFVAFCKQRR